MRRGGVPGIGSLSACRGVKEAPRERLANCSAVNRRPVFPNAVGWALLGSAGGVLRKPEAGGVMRPERKLFWDAGLGLLLEGVWFLAAAGEERMLEILFNEG